MLRKTPAKVSTTASAFISCPLVRLVRRRRPLIRVPLDLPVAQQVFASSATTSYSIRQNRNHASLFPACQTSLPPSLRDSLTPGDIHQSTIQPTSLQLSSILFSTD